MIPPILVLTPADRCDPRLVIAAARSGACGILDLGLTRDDPAGRAAIAGLRQGLVKGRKWGVRWDLAPSAASLNVLAQLAGRRLPLVVLAGVDFSRENLEQLRRQTKSVARRVLVEACSASDALAAQDAGFEGVVLVGSEAGARVQSSYILLQQVHGKLRIPYWIRGGIGPQTAAAALLSGAAGVVLAEQLWLAIEAPFTAEEKAVLARLDGASEKGDSPLLPERPDQPSVGARCYAQKGTVPFFRPDIGLAAELSRKHGTVARIVAAYRSEVERALRSAEHQQSLAADSALAKSLGVKYPILQAPMAGAGRPGEFCQAVSANGALPLVSMGTLGPPELDELLRSTSAKLGDAPWGVSMLGYLPPRFHNEQLAAVQRFRPNVALLEGGQPSQARELEQLGVHTFVHVPSATVLRKWLDEGLRRFVVEGTEAAGHVGTASSFAIWQSAVQVLLDSPVGDPENVEVVLAGGIHDALSAAMAAVIVAPLAARGMKVGVLMGTAYLFTPEAVATGAITAGAQQQAIACRQTELLVTGPGRATRVAPSPWVDKFHARRRALAEARKTAVEIARELEQLIDEAFRGGQGLQMLGEVATLRDRAQSMAELHQAVCEGSLAMLAGAPERIPNWGPHGRAGLRRVPLAVVGLGCMFPRSPDVRRYWQNILQRFDAIEEIPADRWRWQDFYDPDRRAPDRCYSKWGAFLGEIAFDPVRYRMPPASLASIEPVQLMALEVARQALEDAGIGRPGFPLERTAVLFAAAGSNDLGLWYAFRTGIRHWLPRVNGLDAATRERIVDDLERQLPKWTEDSFAGFLLNVVAGRIANRFDLKGANFTVDAACASSFAALQTAAEQLWAGTCDAALVGAVDGTNNPFTYMCFSKTYALSPEGRSRPFDAGADGIGLGEGIGAVVIKRLDDAQRDGDKIYAVIRGIGSSSDGSARSLTAPFPDGQALAVRRAYEQAQVSPATVTLVEAHGTGTTVGDQVEVQALTQAFAAAGARPRACAIGSVKSMIGHTKTVAGMASLIKTTLALRHKILPPTIGVTTPNLALSSEVCPFYVSSEARPWFDGRHPRRAGVSAFGFGGTNFHVVLEEYRDVSGGHECPDMTPRSAEVFFWSRRGREALVESLKALEAQLAAAPTDDLTQLAYAVHRDEQPAAADASSACRLAIVAESVEDLRRKIALAIKELPARERFEYPAGVYYSQAARLQPRQVCFLFPGQGSQSVNMLRDLVLSSPWAWDAMERADRELAVELSGPLTSCIYPQPAFSDDERRRQQERLNDTRVTQPALALVEQFALGVLERFGLQPGMVAGHSYGEWMALRAAGVLDGEALVRLSALRGQATYEACSSTPGAMASVAADGPATLAALAALKIDALPANFNAECQTVIAGSTAAIEAALAQLPSKGLQVRRIPVTAPFHTPAVAGVSEVMRRHLAQVEFRRPRMNVYSNTTAGLYPGDPVQIRERLAEHIARPVLFAKMVQQAHADGARLFVEVGPGSVLTSLVRRNLKDREHLALALDGPSGWTALGHLLARLAVEGLAVTWPRWFENRGLSDGSLDEFFRAVRAKNERKPTDWIVGPGGARPCAAMSKRLTKEQPASAAQPSPQAPRSGRRERVARNEPSPPAPLPQAVEGRSSPKVITGMQQKRENIRMGPQEQPNDTPQDPRGCQPGVQTVIGQFQSSMAQWLDLQKQFLETQQNVMLACFQGTNGHVSQPTVLSVGVPSSLPRPAAVPTPALPAPAAVSPAAPARPRAPQAPVLPTTLKATAAPVVTPAPAPTVKVVATAPEPVSAPVSTSAPARVAAPTALALTPAARPALVAQSAAMAQPATAADGPPPVEVFRQDLLEVISDRTGYPIEMLDEKLDLETGLGIDSIKILEILSLLGKYHAYLPGASEDQEATMATFASLRTIGDIIQSYQTNSQRTVTAQASPVPSGNGASHRSPVQRATLQAVAAGHEGNGTAKKKSSLAAISS